MNRTIVMLGVVVAASAVFVYLMSDRILAPADWSYIMEPAYRVTLGQMAYRDFFLVLTPGIIYTVAGLMLLGGGNIPMLVFVLVVQATTIVLSFFIYRNILKDNALSLLLTLPTAATFHAFYPFPSYETTAMVFILGSFLLALKGLERKEGVALWILAGALATIAPLYKQNTGGVYLIAFFLSLFLARFAAKTPPSWKQILSAIAGTAAVSTSFFLWLLGNGALENFIYQTVTFPGEVRGPLEMLPGIVSGYFNVYSLALYASFGGLLLALRYFANGKYRDRSFRASAIATFIIFPFALAVALWAMGKIPAYNLRNYYGSLPLGLILVGVGVVLHDLVKRSRKETTTIDFFLLPPIMVIVISHLSQGVYGSSLFLEFPNIMLIAAILLRRFDEDIKAKDRLWGAVAAIVPVTLFLGYASWVLLRFGIYAFPEEIQSDAKHPKLNHIGAPHNVVTRLDSLARYIQTNIPKNDPIVEIPYEDPIYYLTDRTPPVFFSSFDMYPPIGGSFPLARTDEQLFQNNIKWFIVRLPTTPDQKYAYTYLEVIEKIQARSTKVYSIPGYNIYLNESYEK
ncbi:MAG: hypothetical protein GF419_03425 [Ignavibacteriales bacterium]|nr:hypothetical protein [Ignavibacteriales bacterium]